MSPGSEILSWNKFILECVQDDKIFERLYSNHIFRVNRFLVLCVCFVDRYLSFYPFYCLSFFDLRILITPLISSSSSFLIPQNVRSYLKSHNVVSSIARHQSGLELTTLVILRYT
jgi:hypothetical protein